MTMNTNMINIDQLNNYCKKDNYQFHSIGNKMNN